MSDTTLLPHGVEVAFADINVAARDRDRSRAANGQALMGTVVAIGPDERLVPAAETLQRLEDRIAVRTLLIASGESGAPAARVAGNAIAIPGLKPQFVDNAVAALRLSSLPTVVWFRGGPPDMLDSLANLADRVILDEVSPMQGWRHAVQLREHSAFSDLRWARLTRWRALMAHFFDIPGVRAAAPAFNRLRIAGSDRMAANLYGAWLTTTLSLELEIEFEGRPEQPPIDQIVLRDRVHELALRLLSNRTCVRTTATIRGERAVTRTVSLGDQSLTALIAAELRIRARDIAYERAMNACTTAATS